MKSALLLSGQPRTFEFCFPSLKEHILDVYHPDIFIVTDATPDQERRLRELYKPVAMENVDQETINAETARLRAEAGHPDPVPERVLSVAYKHLRCVQLKKDYEATHGSYDVVILSRFDVKFASVQKIGPVEEDVFYLPLVDAYPVVSWPVRGLHWGGYSTHTCWMSSKTCDKLQNIYFAPTDWLELASKVMKWGDNPEHVLKYFCDNNGIRPEFVEIDMMLIRGTSENPLGFDHKPIFHYPRFATTADGKPILLSLTEPAERDCLQRLAKEVPAGGLVVEIGSLYGGTTSILASSQPRARLITIDNFGWHPDGFEPTSKRLLLENMSKLGIGNVEVLEGDSREIGKAWTGDIDLIFIDGGHSFEFVYPDLCNFAPHARVVALHDFDNPAWASVRNAVEKFISENPNWQISEVAGTVVVLRRVK